MQKVQHDRLTRFNSNFKVTVCSSWKENTGFQDCKSKEQLLRKNGLLKKGKSVSS